jgi:integrase
MVHLQMPCLLTNHVRPRRLKPQESDLRALGITHVLELYRWANARGDVRIDSRNLDLEEVGVVAAPSAPQARPFTYEEWRRLRKAIGSLPSDPGYAPERPEKAPCRDRLMCEIAIHTGMRRHEICALTIYQIWSLEPRLPEEEAGQEFAAKGLWLTVVKGGAKRARDAVFPVWLIRELLRYIDGAEREKAAEIYAKNHRGRKPSALFLNHAWSRHAPGEVFSEKRLTARFTEIVVKAGFVERVERTDPSTGEMRTTERPTHSIHDLRHTAAVWRYMVERKLGNPDPWKPVQVMLGHAQKETTTRTYLRITNTFEAEVSDAALRYFREIAASAPYTQVID